MFPNQYSTLPNFFIHAGHIVLDCFCQPNEELHGQFAVSTSFARRSVLEHSCFCFDSFHAKPVTCRVNGGSLLMVSLVGPGHSLCKVQNAVQKVTCTDHTLHALQMGCSRIKWSVTVHGLVSLLPSFLTSLACSEHPTFHIYLRGHAAAGHPGEHSGAVHSASQNDRASLTKKRNQNTDNQAWHTPKCQE